jgi:hypothetical protein
MKSWFGTMFGWFSSSNGSDRPAEVTKVPLSDYEQRIRQLDERGGRLFLP